MPNHCATECRYGSPSVAAVKIELHWPLMAAGLPLLGGSQRSTWLGGCWNHVRGCVDRETGEGMHEAALCVVKWMAQTGKTSAEPEYYLGLIFFSFCVVVFHKKKILPCIWFLCSVCLLLQSVEDGWGRIVPRTGSYVEKRLFCFHQVLPALTVCQ